MGRARRRRQRRKRKEKGALGGQEGRRREDAVDRAFGVGRLQSLGSLRRRRFDRC